MENSGQLPESIDDSGAGAIHKIGRNLMESSLPDRRQSGPPLPGLLLAFGNAFCPSDRKEQHFRILLQHDLHA